MLLFPFQAWAAPAREWVITLEEPTGIYRRDREVVAVRYQFQPGEALPGKVRVLGPDGKETLSQLAVRKHPDGTIQEAEVLFEASLIPGERPEYRLVQGPPAQASTSSLTARRAGVGRVEMANDRFGVILNLGLEGTKPALIAAFNKSAGENRMMNLLDT